MNYLNFDPGYALISWIFFNPSERTNYLINLVQYFLAALSLGSVFWNWWRTYGNISSGASEINGSNAGRWVHIYRILFNAWLDFFFRSSLES